MKKKLEFWKMNYKLNLTPEQLEKYLTRKHIVVSKKYYKDELIYLELCQCGDGEFGLDTLLTISFEPSIEHLQMLSKHNIYLHKN